MRFVLSLAVVALMGVSVTLVSGQPAPRPLTAGAPVEQSISGTDVHAYTFQAGANSTLSIVVRQKGIDVLVTLLAPDGRKIAEVDSPNGMEGPEPLSALVEAAGTYRVEVRRLADAYNSQSGPYEVRLETLRRGTAAELRTHAEQKVVRAQRAMGTGGCAQ